MVGFEAENLSCGGIRAAEEQLSAVSLNVRNGHRTRTPSISHGIRLENYHVAGGKDSNMMRQYKQRVAPWLRGTIHYGTVLHWIRTVGV